MGPGPWQTVNAILWHFTNVIWQFEETRVFFDVSIPYLVSLWLPFYNAQSQKIPRVNLNIVLLWHFITLIKLQQSSYVTLSRPLPSLIFVVRHNNIVVSCTLQWPHNECDGVSNHRRLDCLLDRLFRCKSKKTSKLRATGFCQGNSRWPANSPHIGPVTRIMYPFDDVIMIISRHWDGSHAWNPY